MKLRWVGIAGLGFLVGCVRLGYSAHHQVDADGGAVGMDAAVADAGTWQDAAALDAGHASATDLDAAAYSRDASASDAGTVHDSGAQHDASVASDAAAPHDAGAPEDAGAASDSGYAADSGRPIVCTETATTVMANTYDGKPHYHGWLTLQNTSNVSWTLLKISFDLSSTGNICNDVDVMPGPDWVLASSAGHCEYTQVNPMSPLAPNGAFTLQYSTDIRTTVADPAVSNISVQSCE